MVLNVSYSPHTGSKHPDFVHISLIYFEESNLIKYRELLLLINRTGSCKNDAEGEFAKYP